MIDSRSEVSLAQSAWFEKHKLVSASKLIHHVHKMSAINNLSVKDKQTIIIIIILPLEKGGNLSTEYGASKQQISNIRKNKGKIMKLRQDH